MKQWNKALFLKKLPKKNSNKLLLKLSRVSFQVKKEWIESSIVSLGAKEFAAEAVKATSEYATQAGEYVQEKVPEVLEAGKEFAAKAVEVGQEYGKEALEKTEKYAEQVYEAGKEKAEELLRDAKKKLDL